MANPGEALPTSKNSHLKGRAGEVGGGVGVEWVGGGGFGTLVRVEVGGVVLREEMVSSRDANVFQVEVSSWT